VNGGKAEAPEQSTVPGRDCLSLACHVAMKSPTWRSDVAALQMHCRICGQMCARAACFQYVGEVVQIGMILFDSGAAYMRQFVIL
jgi:hypothetical protein